MFLNGILTNAEVWYGITKAEIEQLEALDMDLLRQILNTPFSVPSEGSVPGAWLSEYCHHSEGQEDQLSPYSAKTRPRNHVV